MQYLNPQEIKARVSSGKRIEQWLSAEKINDYIVLKWLSIFRERDAHFSVVYTECFDNGNEEFLDIYAFTPVNADEEFTTTTFEAFDEALDFAFTQYNAHAAKFVAAGMLQDEYLKYLKRLN